MTAGPTRRVPVPLGGEPAQPLPQEYQPFYQDEQVSLHLGDCFDILPRLQGPVGIVLTDPPWAAGAYLARIDEAGAAEQEAEAGWFGLLWTWYGSWMTALMRLKPACGWYFVGASHLGAFLRVANLLAWPIQHAWPCRGHEWLLYVAPAPLIHGPESVRGWLADAGTPNVKPGWLVRNLILASEDGGHQLVLDPFCGDGSTLVTARDLGYRAVGIETKEARCLTAAAALRRQVSA